MTEGFPRFLGTFCSGFDFLFVHGGVRDGSPVRIFFIHNFFFGFVCVVSDRILFVAGPFLPVLTNKQPNHPLLLPTTYNLSPVAKIRISANQVSSPFGSLLRHWLDPTLEASQSFACLPVHARDFGIVYA